MAELKDIVADGMAYLQSAIRAELDAQGHGGNTGKLSKSVTYEVEAGDGRAVGRMFFEDYGFYVEFGVRASRIPYGGRGKGKKGGTSAYIEGLVRFFQHRGLSGREALGAAFATAKTHKREGMPSRGSYAYSNNGRRTGFVSNALKDFQKELSELLSSKFATLVQINFANTGILTGNQQNRFSYEVGI